MERRKFYSKSRYAWAFFIGTLIFFFGFYITFLISQAELRSIGEAQSKISYGLFEQKLKESFFNQDICDSDIYQTLNNYRSIQIGSIGALEKKLGINNKLVLERKKFYTLIQISHLEFIEQRKKECKDNSSILFYFYSNDPNDYEESNRVGRIIDVFGEERKDVQIYSFDFNLESELIELMKNKYNISEYPSIINPYGNRIKSPKNIKEIEELFS